MDAVKKTFAWLSITVYLMLGVALLFTVILAPFSVLCFLLAFYVYKKDIKQEPFSVKE